MSEGYDRAQVCPNGHVANSAMLKMPQHNKEFCEKCGEKTLSICPKCQEGIRGYYWGGSGFGNYKLPAFCANCGQAFPWTELKTQAAIELFLDEIGSEEEAKKFGESVHEITRDTPMTQVASNRITRALAKIKGPVAEAIRKILVDIASETAKKALFPK